MAEKAHQEANSLDLLPAVRDAVARHRLINRGERVLVAVSGGPDSVALCHLLLRLAGEMDMQLHVFHMDHGLREGSAADAHFVQRLADEWGVPLTLVRENVGAGRRRGESTQQAARRLRYAALRRTAAQIGAARIALGHHGDDQAETVLMRLLRGAGAAGLGGMRWRRGRFIRPLLGVSRADVEAYCQAFRLDTRLDPTNESTDYVRNKVRLELLPLLQAEYNANVRLTLNRMAMLLQDDDDLLEYLAHQAFRRMFPGAAEQLPEDGRDVSSHHEVSGRAADVELPVHELARQPRALRRRIVRHAWQYVAGKADEAVVRPTFTPAALTYDHVEAVLALLDKTRGAAVDLPRKVRVQRLEHALIFRRFHIEESAPPLDELLAVPLVVPGRTALWGGQAMEASFIQQPPAGARPGRHEAWLDWEKLAPPLVARTWRPGDRMRPFGLGGTKKLQDLFVDEKIPAAERRSVPVVVDKDGIVWVAGLRVDERAAAKAPSGRILQLKIAPL